MAIREILALKLGSKLMRSMISEIKILGWKI